VNSVRTIEEISVEIASGIACALSQVVADGVLHLRPFSVTEDGRLVTSDAPRIPHAAVPPNKMRFEVGDILFNNTNSVELVGKSAVFSTALEASFSNHMTRLRVDRRYAEPGYVQAFLRHLYGRRFFQDRATRWVSQAAFGTAQLKALEIPLPPLSEQQRIVGLLDRAAEIRHRADAARAKARAIIPALFLDTFGDPASNANDWPVLPISGAGEVKLGRQRAPKYQSGNFTRPYVRVANVYEDRIDITDLLSMDFDARDFATYKLENGDILLNEGQSTELVGRPAMWRDEVQDCCFQNTLVRFRADRRHVDPTFALQTFLWMYRGGQLSQISSKTSNVAHLGAARFAKLEMVVPPIAHQTAFAEQVQRLEALARHLDAAATKAEAMAAGLSAEVFDKPPQKGNGDAGAQAGQ
jgi:type I restriction enzyme S subunit